MRSFFKIFALITFIGDCIVSIGKIYPDIEQAWRKYQERKEALKTEEEREAERQEKEEKFQANGGEHQQNSEQPRVVPLEHHQGNVQDAEFEELKSGRL